MDYARTPDSDLRAKAVDEASKQLRRRRARSLSTFANSSIRRAKTNDRKTAPLASHTAERQQVANQLLRTGWPEPRVGFHACQVACSCVNLSDPTRHFSRTSKLTPRSCAAFRSDADRLQRCQAHHRR